MPLGIASSGCRRAGMLRRRTTRPVGRVLLTMRDIHARVPLKGASTSNRGARCVSHRTSSPRSALPKVGQIARRPGSPWARASGLPHFDRARRIRCGDTTRLADAGRPSAGGRGPSKYIAALARARGLDRSASGAALLGTARCPTCPRCESRRTSHWGSGKSRRVSCGQFAMAGLAHRVERSPRKREAGGSRPPASTTGACCNP
jgi:hypothetical protein